MKKNCIEKAIDLIEAEGHRLDGCQAVFGFDGFVDTIMRPVKKGDSLNVEQLYSTMEEFGNFIAERSGKSCSIELKEYETKLGGNTPICANALGGLGAKVTCIGAFGYPERHRVFNNMSENCTIVSVENPGVCMALEFTDGKAMLAMNNGINSLDWDTVKRRAGIDDLIATIGSCDLLGLFNWGELPYTTDIWKGILNEVVPHINKGKWVIFDLSDCTSKSESELLDVLNIIAGFGKHSKTVISLNENEARAICSVIFNQKDISLEEAGMRILKQLDIFSVVFHLYDRSIAFEPSGISQSETYLIEEPLVTTGAGDNFNGGLCAALLLGMNMSEALAVASLSASFYVANGRSPVLQELISFVRNEILK